MLGEVIDGGVEGVDDSRAVSLVDYGLILCARWLMTCSLPAGLFLLLPESFH